MNEKDLKKIFKEYQKYEVDSFTTLDNENSTFSEFHKNRMDKIIKIDHDKKYSFRRALKLSTLVITCAMVVIPILLYNNASENIDKDKNDKIETQGYSISNYKRDIEPVAKNNSLVVEDKFVFYINSQKKLSKYNMLTKKTDEIENASFIIGNSNNSVFWLNLNKKKENEVKSINYITDEVKLVYTLKEDYKEILLVENKIIIVKKDDEIIEIIINN